MPLRRALAAAAIAVLAVLHGAAAAAPRSAPRQAVALLPLDADARLEIYGQAVATEISRALISGGVEVVVVGAKMDVPADARLIVDGTLATDKGVVALSMRIRNPLDGTVLDTLSATAPSLAQIDKAAADLSARVVPVVRQRLAALPPDRGTEPVRLPPNGRPPAGGPPRSLLVGIGSPAEAAPLRAALADAALPWARAARREPRPVDVRDLGAKLAPKAVATANAERAIAFEILDYAITTKADIPLVRARVRVRISDASAVVFSRVVETDTIVGERRMSSDALASRVAQEVLAILRPHMRRAVPPWP